MYLKDFLNDIKIRMPHPFSDNEVAEFINRILPSVADCALCDEITTIKSVAGVEIYPLTSNIVQSSIREVVVDGIQYKPVLVEEKKRNGTYYIPLEGYIAVSPPPKISGKLIEIYHGNAERLLSLAEIKNSDKSLTDEDAEKLFNEQAIPVQSSSIELLSAGIFFMIASGREDTELANNYLLEFNFLKNQALQRKYRKRGKYPVVRFIS